ncbi:hypothetical protein NST74_26260 [Paenibacillus sp. FSL F4-0125]
MADYSAEIDEKGRFHQYWKKYATEGGYSLVHGTFTWDTKNNKYKASGQFVLQ